MTCYVCKYRFCWICGLHSEHIFHKLQIDNAETGALCVFINNVLEIAKESKTGMCCLPCVYLLLFIVCCVGPILFLALCIASSILAYPFVPPYLTFSTYTFDSCCRPIKNKCCSFTLKFLLTISLYPVTLLLYAIALPISLFCLALYYLIGLFLILRMCYQQCCVPRKASESQRHNIDQLMERRRSEHQVRKTAETQIKEQY